MDHWRSANGRFPSRLTGFSAIVLGLFGLILIGCQSSAAAVGETTRRTGLFTGLPCAGCHGLSAQGQFGPPLAGTSLTFDQVQQQVRSPRDKMPAFDATAVRDDELRHIYAWLTSLPTPEPTPSVTLPPAEATVRARERRFPPMDAAALAVGMETIDELTLQVSGEIVSVEENGRYTRVRLRMSQDDTTLDVLGLYDTALARQSFPAAVGDRVTLYGVGAEPVVDPEASDGSNKRLPRLQILDVSILKS
jgi:hypothetical protein